MEALVYIATSLDGYIADADGGVDWLNEIPNPSGSDFGFGEFIDRVDAIVMGRKSFETVVSFGVWPYTKPVYVISRSMKELPAEYDGKASLMTLSPREIVDHFASKGARGIYVDGGALIRSFLRESLVDEITVTTVPILLGSGIPLFQDVGLRSDWDHAGTEVLNDMLVKTTYRRSAEA